MSDQQQDEKAPEQAPRSESKPVDDKKKRTGYDTLSDENPLICRGID